MIELEKYPGYYAGRDGNIYSTNGRWTNGELLPLRGGLNGKGTYLHVTLPIPGSIPKKYRSIDIHKVMAEAYLGPRPEGMTISHENGDSLDNRPENLAYRAMAENHAMKLKHGTHDRGTNNTRSKLTSEDIDNIFKLRARGELQQDIADRFGVARSTVTEILNGKRYRKVNDET